MKILSELSPVTGFEYRDTQKSRARLSEMAFCNDVEREEGGSIWVTDNSPCRYFVDPYDWIIVQDGCILDVIDPAMFEARYSIVGDEVERYTPDDYAALDEAKALLKELESISD
jgi:hypothetical protein